MSRAAPRFILRPPFSAHMSSLEISKSLLAHLELQPPPRETILQELAELELVRLWTFDVAEEALSGDEQETREEARALLKRIHTVIGHRVAKKRFRAADLFWRCLVSRSASPPCMNLQIV